MPNTSGNRTKRGGIQSIDRAARILNALASGARRLGVSELAQRLELAPGTVHGLLQALQAHGFVEQDRNSGKYQPGAGLLQLGTSYSTSTSFALAGARRAARSPSRCRRARRCGAMARA